MGAACAAGVLALAQSESRRKKGRTPIWQCDRPGRCVLGHPVRPQLGPVSTNDRPMGGRAVWAPPPLFARGQCSRMRGAAAEPLVRARHPPHAQSATSSSRQRRMARRRQKKEKEKECPIRVRGSPATGAAAETSRDVDWPAACTWHHVDSGCDSSSPGWDGRRPTAKTACQSRAAAAFPEGGPVRAAEVMLTVVLLVPVRRR